MDLESNKSEIYNNNKLKLRLFPYLKNKTKIGYLKIDPESINYISMREYAKKISEILKYHLVKKNINPREAIITDATAGIGGNTISFAQYFKFVHAIELDKTRAEYLQNNINIYELSNVQVYNQDCLELTKNLNQQVVFIDPPWGGKNYKMQKNLRLIISNISLESYCNQLFDKNITKNIPSIIILKLPRNYDLLYFYSVLTEKTIFYYNLTKMIILVIIRQ